MAAYEVLLLNTAIPQIQAAQSGDTYLVPRDIAFSAALTLSAGTANGVPYLNASKVLTTGSALTFDGTNFNVVRAAATDQYMSLYADGTGPTLKFFGGAAGKIAGIMADSASASMYFTNEGNKPFVYAINGSEVMRLTSTGLKASIAGTNADPVFSYTSDTNTGIFFPAADKLGFTAGGGSDQMVLTSTGLGVGASLPAAKLDVATTTPFTFDTTSTAGVKIGTQGAVGGSFMVQTQSASAPYGSGLAIDGTYSGATLQSTVNIKSFGVYSGGGYGSSLAFWTSSGTTLSQKMLLDSSGNLGLGVTPSASWNNIFKAMQIGSASYLSVAAQTTATARGSILWNAIGSGDESFVYRNTGDPANRFMVGSGFFAWYTAGTGTAGDPITFTQAMTLEASGRLLVGVTSGSYALDVGDVSGGNMFRFTRSGVELSSYISSGLPYFGTTSNTALLLMTNNTERARITSGGYFKASNTGTYQDATGLYHELRSNSSDINTLFVGNTSASPYGQVIRFASASPDNNTNWFFTCEDSTTTRMYVYSDGDLANHDGVYGTISDQKLKQDIVDAGSQWDDIKAIRFRKYRMKSDVAANPDAPALLGVVAQELEQVSPGLVDEHPDMETVEVTDEDGNVTQTQQPTGTTTKTVKSSILLMKAAVALQEAMARIEKLEAEVAALKGA